MSAVVQVAIFLAVLLACVPLLAGYMARVYQGQPTLPGRLLGPLERLLYRASGVRPDDEMGWKRYAWAMLLFNVAGAVVVFGLQRLQHVLPLNPQGFAAVSPDLASRLPRPGGRPGLGRRTTCGCTWRNCGPSWRSTRRGRGT